MVLLKTAFYIIFGYLSGSVLYARVFEAVFKKEDMIDGSKDGNPGTANAFMRGGFLCGVLTLAFDILKGFVPVFMFMRALPDTSLSGFGGALVIAAPVIGHAFPVFFGFKGGKGIAVSFGCLLGLLPMWQPVAVLAGAFIFFSLVLRVRPHYHRTLVTYLCALAFFPFIRCGAAAVIGFAFIALTVCAKMLTSKEEKEKFEVKLLWMR